MKKQYHSDSKVEKLCKIWKTGKYSSKREMAKDVGVNYNTLSALLRKGPRLRETIPCPKGNYRPYKIYGKHFLVYDDGRVWSFSRNRLVGSYNPLGYKWIGVVNDVTGKLENKMVHRIMLEVFVRPPKEGEIGRHLDDNPRNIRLKNLAWGTPAENSADMVSNGTQAHGESNGFAKLTRKIVDLLMKEYDGSEYKPFARAFIRKYGLQVGMLSIVRVLRGQTWSHYTQIEFKQRQQGKLDKRAVIAIHRNLAKWEGSPKEFSRKYAEFLRKHGYLVTSSAVYKAQRGATWPELYR